MVVVVVVVVVVLSLLCGRKARDLGGRGGCLFRRCGLSRQVPLSQQVPLFLPQEGGCRKAGSFEQGGGRFAHPPTRQGFRLADDELEGRAWGRLRVHVQVAQQPGYDGYLGVEAAMAGGGCERKFQHALTAEVEAWRFTGTRRAARRYLRVCR
jgi:hypothetical protein